MKLIPARCPSCGADIEVNRDYETTKCKYCDTKVIIDDAIAKYKIEIENMPTAKSYLKLGARNLEHGELTKAQELLEKALEINPDSPETIIKENLSKVLQHELTEKDFDKVLYSFKDASKFCSSAKLDELIMYSIKLLDKERMETFEYVSGRIPKTIFVRRVELFMLFLSFYERVYRNNITSVDNKIFMIKKIFACIQCYRNAHIEKHDSANYAIPAEQAKYLLKKEEQYKEELAKLDENYEKKKRELEEEQKRLEEEQIRKEKAEQEAKARAEAERLRLLKAKKERQKAFAILFGATAIDIVCSIIDLIICGLFIFVGVIFVLYFIFVDFELTSLLLTIIALMMSLPIIVLKILFRKIKFPKILFNIFGFLRYMPVLILLITAFGISPAAQIPFSGKTFISADEDTQIYLEAGVITIETNTEKIVDDYDYEYNNEEYTIKLEKNKELKYKYFNSKDELCLLNEKETCSTYYKIKKDAE